MNHKNEHFHKIYFSIDKLYEFPKTTNGYSSHHNLPDTFPRSINGWCIKGIKKMAIFITLKLSMVKVASKFPWKIKDMVHEYSLKYYLRIRVKFIVAWKRNWEKYASGITMFLKWYFTSFHSNSNTFLSKYVFYTNVK